MTTEHSTPPSTLIAQVVASAKIRNAFVRVTLAGSDLRHIDPNCEGGHLKLLLPKSGSCTREHLERLRDNWRPHCFARTYTLLAHRPESHQIDIDIALHPGQLGPGGTWVRDLTLGTPVLLTNPKGKKLRRNNASFYLFACDSCSFPAVCAAVRDLPASALGIVLVQSDDAEDQRTLSQIHPGLIVHHVKRELSTPPPVNAAAHLKLLRSLNIPSPDTECFIVGESRVVKEIKRYVQNELLIDTDGMYFSAYWKHNHDQDQHKQSKKAEKDQKVPQVEVLRKGTLAQNKSPV